MSVGILTEEHKKHKDFPLTWLVYFFFLTEEHKKHKDIPLTSLVYFLS